MQILLIFCGMHEAQQKKKLFYLDSFSKILPQLKTGMKLDLQVTTKKAGLSIHIMVFNLNN